MEKAIVKRVIGPVVDIHFPEGALPELYNAIEVPLEDRKVVMEVVQQIGGGDVRCIALSSTDGISRGCEARNTGSSITMPVGEATLGRMFNVVGEPIDGKGPVDAPGCPFTAKRPALLKSSRPPRFWRRASRWWTCWHPIPAAARSACSAAPAWARPC